MRQWYCPAYLGEGDTSELYKELVVKRKLALAAAASYDYASRSYGTFGLSAVPAAGVSPQELQKMLDRVVNDAVASLTDEKVEKVKNKMLAGLVYLRDNPNDAAYIVGSLYTRRMTREDIENYADNIRYRRRCGGKKGGAQDFYRLGNDGRCGRTAERGERR